ncbi:BMP family ABC transporter substrate-binding protein [Nocardioides mangrovicus]|uniref:BMP family ABC transporter substrate-binding protein n=1 Tax=Nocardioides mangrovicus TaxID=2478913 RepID=A0A3L8P3Z5_9ACTN|nr:BMP family ABC transporter substrate-binding protein [Nocardioides mangrovicus]RLV49995.1 BMP family ABC transporter substrate-binding protein [Nocardioides mangrovicus]
MRLSTKIMAGLGVLTLAATAAGCGKPASSGDSGGSGSSSSKSISACMVLDTGGVDDHSFNQASWAGLQAASKANSSIKSSYVSSNSQNDYTPNLTTETNKGCDTVIAVGGLMSDAVKKVAKANPKQHYAEIDSSSSGSNVYGLQYNTAQGGFLGGYLAAGMSKTGTVATYGGLNIPPVTIYMDGFWEGVQYYNKQKNKSVKVLGWDETKPKAGTFAQSFTDQNKGKAITQAFEQQGADVVFPVAGGTGLGSGAAAEASGGKLMLIWVDTDGCESASQYCKYFLSSVTKGLTKSTQEYAEAAAKGSFPSGNYVGTLKNGGTGLAPYHDWESKIPSDLQSEIKQVASGIEDGSITITSQSQPTS